MWTKLLASLSDTDRTVALILALLIGITAVSGTTVYVVKRGEARDDQTVADLRAEITGLRVQLGGERAEITRLNTEIVRAKDEYVTDLKEQRDKVNGVATEFPLSSHNLGKENKQNSKKIKILTDEFRKKP